MNKRIKKLWIEALESGKYRQTTGHLRTFKNKRYSYCCLGVLCDLYKKETGDGYWSPGTSEFCSNDEDEDYLHMSATSELPEFVQEWAGINESNPEVSYEYKECNLAELNDIHELNFKEIAKVIKKQLQ